MEGVLSWPSCNLLTANFNGFCRLFSDFDISMLLIEDSIASSTIIEFASVLSYAVTLLLAFID